MNHHAGLRVQRSQHRRARPIKGLLEADSPKTLRSQLRKDGIFLTDVLGQAEGSRAAVRKGAGAKLAARDIDLRKLARGRITTDDIAITTRQLATLLGAGVTLVESLTALVDQVEKERFKRVLSDVKQRVNEGSSLADALAPAPEDLRLALREHGARRREPRARWTRCCCAWRTSPRTRPGCARRSSAPCSTPPS